VIFIVLCCLHGEAGAGVSSGVFFIETGGGSPTDLLLIFKSLVCTGKIKTQHGWLVR
jgi:hypothetical protein